MKITRPMTPLRQRLLGVSAQPPHAVRRMRGDRQKSIYHLILIGRNHHAR